MIATSSGPTARPMTAEASVLTSGGVLAWVGGTSCWWAATYSAGTAPTPLFDDGLVYGVVGLIVKMDDVGLHLSERNSGTARRVGLLLVRGMPKLVALLFTVGVVAMLLSAGCSNLTPGTDWPVALISRALNCRLVSRRRWTGSLQATSAARPGLLQPGLLATPRGWAPTSRQAANSELKSPCRPVRPESLGFGRSGLVSGEAEGLC